MKKVLAVLLGVSILAMPMSTSFAGDCGDVNNDSTINIFDITYLISYLYLEGPEPYCGTSFVSTCGDVNNDSAINIFDITYLIGYLYLSGPPSDCGTVTDINGNVYLTVRIGNQVWMAENLKVTHYCNGDLIPNITDRDTWSALTTGAYCNYNNNGGHVATYGRLYNWFAVNDSRNIAPEGWHVPTDTEWKQLEMYLGMSQADADATNWWLRGTDEGGKLKEAGTTHWEGPNPATNESGFTALPGGYRSRYGNYYYKNMYAHFWTSAEYDSIDAWRRCLSFNNSLVYRGYFNKQSGFSVRCVKD